MTQKALVEKILDGNQAVIAVRRKAACASDCESCHGCAHPEETIKVTAYNQAGAGVGDTVVVESSSRQVIGLAALLYLMPPLLMVAGYLAVPAAEGWRIAASIGGLCLGLGVCVAFSARMKKRGRMTFCITGIESRQDLQ